jgi:hypothetical protein
MSPHPDSPRLRRAFARTIASPASAFLVIALATAVAGCRANLAPVLNVVDAPVANPAAWTQPPGAPVAARAQGTVRVAILQALAAKSWTVDEERIGLILATVQVPPHFGQIAITYNDRAYSIYHRGSSPTLKYDGQIIHRRYNNWIAQLRKTIDEQLSASQPGALAGPTPAMPARPPGPSVPPPGWAPAPAAGGWPAPGSAPTPVPAVPPGQKPPAPAGGGWPAPGSAPAVPPGQKPPGPVNGGWPAPGAAPGQRPPAPAPGGAWPAPAGGWPAPGSAPTPVPAVPPKAR